MQQQKHESKGQDKDLLWVLDGLAPPSCSRAEKQVCGLGQGNTKKRKG